MNDVDELKEYAATHARRHKIRGWRELLGRIHTDDRGLPGSWVWEWCRAGDRLRRDGRTLDACQHYAMARFPFVDGGAREYAHERCLRAFDQWRTGRPGIQRLEVDLTDGRADCWAAGLSASNARPVLLIIGDIVTVKEQWAPVLTRLRRLGLAAVVTEMPGVGENTVRYDATSWRMISAVLDAIGNRADTVRTYVMALGFSGQLAVRCAAEDSRIKGIVTNAPVSDIAADAGWQRQLPRVTVDTFAHLTGQPADPFALDPGDWALPGGQLTRLGIPVLGMRGEHRLQRSVIDLMWRARRSRWRVGAAIQGDLT